MCCQDWEPQPCLPKACPVLSPSCPVPLMVSPGIQIRTSLRTFRVFLESITSSLTGITQRSPSQPFTPHILQIRRWLGFCLPQYPTQSTVVKWLTPLRLIHAILTILIGAICWVSRPSFTDLKDAFCLFPYSSQATHPVSGLRSLTGWVLTTFPPYLCTLWWSLILVFVRKCITSKICF